MLGCYFFFIKKEGTECYCMSQVYESFIHLLVKPHQQSKDVKSTCIVMKKQVCIAHGTKLQPMNFMTKPFIFVFLNNVNLTV